MMDWLLVIAILSGPGAAPVEMPAGRMVDARVCAIAGAGMVAILAQANPGMRFGWRCTRETSA